MPLHWTNTDTKYAVLSAAVPTSFAFFETIYAAKDGPIARFLKGQQYPKSMAPSCQYFYLALNVGTAAPFGYASYLVYKIGGGFDYTDTTVALSLYGATVTAGALALPSLASKNAKTVAIHGGVLAALAIATSVAFYKIDHISGYWSVPFTLCALYYAAMGAKVAGCCGKKAVE